MHAAPMEEETVEGEVEAVEATLRTKGTLAGLLQGRWSNFDLFPCISPGGNVQKLHFLFHW